METAAATNAIMLGASSTLPLKALTTPVTEFTRIPTPTANNTTPIIIGVVVVAVAGAVAIGVTVTMKKKKK